MNIDRRIQKVEQRTEAVPQRIDMTPEQRREIATKILTQTNAELEAEPHMLTPDQMRRIARRILE